MSNTHNIKPDPTMLSDKNFSYATYTENLRPIKNTPWLRNHGSSLADVHKQVGEDLVEDPGFPSMIFLQSEIRAAEMRAQLCEDKIEDVVCTLVYTAQRYSSEQTSMMTESILYSQLEARIKDLQSRGDSGGVNVYVMLAYSEETHQIFWRDNWKLKVDVNLPKYDAKYERRRRAYRGAGL